MISWSEMEKLLEDAKGSVDAVRGVSAEVAQVHALWSIARSLTVLATLEFRKAVGE